MSSSQKPSHRAFKKSVLKKESGVPIYETNIDPIVWEDNKIQSKKVSRVEIKNVEGAALLRNVLTEGECKQFVDVAENLGFCKALVTTSRGMVEDEMRNNKRVIWQTPMKFLNETVWKRIEDHVESKIVLGSRKPWYKCGLNERIRFYRYTGGERFSPHYDGCFARNRSDIERSFYTIIIYLNDDPKRVGGETTFFFNPKNTKYEKPFDVQRVENRFGSTSMGVSKVKPETGSALIFYHSHPLSPLHEGTELSAGSKYVLRSDIMFKQA